ncbi:unnamed protein product, partial [Citrullus colocynthis]
DITVKTALSIPVEFERINGKMISTEAPDYRKAFLRAVGGLRVKRKLEVSFDNLDAQWGFRRMKVVEQARLKGTLLAPSEQTPNQCESVRMGSEQARKGCVCGHPREDRQRRAHETDASIRRNLSMSCMQGGTTPSRQ